MSAPDSVWPIVVRLNEVARFTPEQPLARHLEADEAARAAIAEALDLVSLDRLEADLALSAWFDGVRIDGRWSADIVQTCGVSLEDFPTTLAGEFTVRAAPEGSVHLAETSPEIDIDPDAEDPPDALESDAVDVGAYVVEHLALEIDPFPRKPDAVFEPPQSKPESSPFAVLRRLRDPESEG